MEIFRNRRVIVVGRFAASHGFQQKFVQKFVQSVHETSNRRSVGCFGGDSNPTALFDSARGREVIKPGGC
jgi:hypothetical protein